MRKRLIFALQLKNGIPNLILKTYHVFGFVYHIMKYNTLYYSNHE